MINDVQRKYLKSFLILVELLILAVNISGEIEAFKEYTFCNFEYIMALLHSTSVREILHYLDITLANLLDLEINLVSDSILESVSILSIEPLQFASELIGRLRQLKGEYYPYGMSR